MTPLPSDFADSLVWTSDIPTVKGRYRLRCGEHEKNFQVIPVENDPASVFCIGDDFSTMLFKCGEGEQWARLPDDTKPLTDSSPADEANSQATVPEMCKFCGAALTHPSDLVLIYECGFQDFLNPTAGVEDSKTCLRRQLAAKDAEIAAVKEKMFADDSDSIVASCNCLTKSNDPDNHKKGCKYRLITERDEARRQLAEARSVIKQAFSVFGSSVQGFIDNAWTAKGILLDYSPSGPSPMVEAIRHLLGVIEAHELDSLDCDRKGEKYCSCLSNALTALRKFVPE